MIDAGLFVNEVACSIDLLLVNDDFKADDGLETAVLMSIFTHKRVPEDELPLLETDRRGWWGDLFAEIQGDEIGSKLWTLDRVKTTLETRVKAEEIIRDALQWMIEDGVASDIGVVGEIVSQQQINLAITIERPGEDDTRFDVFWNAQELVR